MSYIEIAEGHDNQVANRATAMGFYFHFYLLRDLIKGDIKALETVVYQRVKRVVKEGPREREREGGVEGEWWSKTCHVFIVPRQKMLT